ncbi:CPBP family intramembrane metalloprotease [Nonomuraea sp. MCN248]|uniref:CPBP family intramembrane metalloprotease n=1 Tax=Nonomuraea corallina TaxID=2989783 RepID=A0ABT4SBC0_9ACTN|nr:CPBP family intramembrane glutamic endopeptidase [Nonomuraea corallina]MDA0634245.1 CPBP family intramembrane metalloprotease [Nonomuraea corallina]
MLVFTVPFLAVDAVIGARILPGLPPAALAFVCPAVAALWLEYRRSGPAGARALLARAFDGRRVKATIWYVPVLLLYPAVVTASYVVLRLTGADVPGPDFSLTLTVLLALGFFAGAVCEELGWSGYATAPLRERWGPLGAALVLGAFWAVWHWPALLLVQRPVSWIAWWSLGTVAIRVIMVWLYGRTGDSVFAMALFHMTVNLGWQLFPVNGSHFDVRLVSTITAAVAVAVVAAGGLRSRHRDVIVP